MNGRLTLKASDRRAEELKRLPGGENYRLAVTFTVMKARSCASDKVVVIAHKQVRETGAIEVDVSALVTEAPKWDDRFYSTGISLERLGTSYISGAAKP